MKKLLLKFWGFLNSIFLQSLLLWIAFMSWNEADFYKGSYNLGMGLVTCMCIFCVVWLQINKSKP
tara:strand:- start:37 stop:231 length:195 start_codon:yes stop_codon:yes gene_type:complete